MLFLLLSVGILIKITGLPALAKTNTTESPTPLLFLEPKNNPIEDGDLAFVQGISLYPISELIVKRPEEVNKTRFAHSKEVSEEIIQCVFRRESGADCNAVGDHGLARGCFQIHIDVHPVTLECAEDYQCSRNYFAQEVSKGNSWMWTEYKNCI